MISEKDAAAALRNVAQVDSRTRMARGYGIASPHLVLGGMIWAVGYVLTGLTPPQSWALIWLPLSALGVLGSFALGYRGAKAVSGNPAGRAVPALRILWSMAACMVFIVATYLLFHPRDILPYLAFPAFLMAFIYVLIGAQGATRFLWIGTAIFAVTATGLTLAPQAIAFWIAAAGGGGLITGGLWMRKA